MSYNPNTQSIFYKKIDNNNLGRDIIIGDLHGNLLALFNILDEINFDESKDRIISTGDIIDRGPNSLDTLRFANNNYFNVARGNHEEFMHSFCLTLKDFMVTSNNFESKNALKFISSFGQNLLSMSSEWLYDLAQDGLLNIDLVEEIITLTNKKSIPHILIVNDNIRELVFTHAALPSSLPRNLNSTQNLIEKHLLIGLKADNVLSELLWNSSHNFVKNNTNVKLLKENINLIDQEKTPLIFHGHTVFSDVIIVGQEIFMDTGCGFEYDPKIKNIPRLSALIWQEKRLIEANASGIINNK